MTNALKIYFEFEAYILEAYELLRLNDSMGYERSMRKAERVSVTASKRLDAVELTAFRTASERTRDVLRKCSALGLTNLEKRLREFRIVDLLRMPPLDAIHAKAA